MAEAKAKKTPNEAICQKEDDEAQQKFQEACTIVDWITLRHGEGYTISTFEPGASAAKKLKALQMVNLVGVSASVSYGKKDGKQFLGIDCASPLAIASQYSPYVNIGRALDLCQQPVRLEDPNIAYPPSRILLLSDYRRDEEQERAGRGCVSMKFLANSDRPEDYKLKAKVKGGEDTLIATWRMWQKQDGTLPGYPGGDFEILATLIEGDWTPEQQTVRNTLRTGFGINKADMFGAIMAANPIPAIMAIAYNRDKTAAKNADKNHATDAGTILAYANGTSFCLREYLISQCLQVSLEYIRAVFNVDADAREISLDNGDPERPCQLNSNSVYKKGNKLTMYRTGVINLSEFTGNLTGLMATCEVPFQFRVMHSAITTSMERVKLASLSCKDGEAVLNQDVKAPVRLQSQSLSKQFYMVQVMDDDEKEQYRLADEGWRVRLVAEKKARDDAALRAAQQQQQQPAVVDAMDDGIDDDAMLQAMAQADEVKAEAEQDNVLDSLVMSDGEEEDEEGANFKRQRDEEEEEEAQVPKNRRNKSVVKLN